MLKLIHSGCRATVQQQEQNEIVTWIILRKMGCHNHVVSVSTGLLLADVTSQPRGGRQQVTLVG